MNLRRYHQLDQQIQAQLPMELMHTEGLPNDLGTSVFFVIIDDSMVILPLDSPHSVARNDP